MQLQKVPHELGSVVLLSSTTSLPFSPPFPQNVSQKKKGSRQATCDLSFFVFPEKA